MKKISAILILPIIFLLPAFAENWVSVISDGNSSYYIDTDSVSYERNSQNRNSEAWVKYVSEENITSYGLKADYTETYWKVNCNDISARFIVQGYFDSKGRVLERHKFSNSEFGYQTLPANTLGFKVAQEICELGENLQKSPK